MVHLHTEPEHHQAMYALFIKICEDLKTTPVILVIILASMVGIAWLTYDHVSRSDFVRLENRFDGLQYALDWNHDDSVVHQTQAEIFSLKQHIAESKTKGIDDAENDRRLDVLQNQLIDYQRRLGILESANTSRHALYNQD